MSILKKLFLSVVVLSSLTMHATDRAALRIDIENIRTARGIIWVGIYDEEADFLVKEKAIILGEEVHRSGRLQVVVPDLRRGDYAVALFHDIDGDGELNRNILGIPTEPFAFSGEPVSRWRLPRFHEVKFDFLHPDQVLTTRLYKWHERN